MVVFTDIWHFTGIILLLHPAPLFLSTLVCPLIVCLVPFSRLFCKPDGCNHRRNMFLMMPSFGIPKKVLRRNKMQELTGGSYDLPSSGLWSLHASTAPYCSDASFIRYYFCSKSTYREVFLNVVQTGWFELPQKWLRILVGIRKKQKVLLGDDNRELSHC